MAELAFAWQWLWLHLAYRARPDSPARCPAAHLPAPADAGRRDGVSGRPADSGEHSEALRDLLERAAHDIRQGWPEAALDCLGRALRLLEESGMSDPPPTRAGLRAGKHNIGSGA